MARATTKPKKEISMEEALWKSADKLRGAIEPAEYKHVVLSLFFLKFASDKAVCSCSRLNSSKLTAETKRMCPSMDRSTLTPPSNWQR